MKKLKIVVIMLVVLATTSCKVPFLNKDGGLVEGDQNLTASGPERFLYVASGNCYTGGVPTAAPTNQILKFSRGGMFIRTVMDYRTQSPGDSPVSIVGKDDDSILSLVDNVNGRHLDELNRFYDSGSLFLVNGGLAATLRDIRQTANKGYLVTRTSAVEKFTAFRTRVTQGTKPFISAPSGACTSMNTALTFAIELKSGKILIGHAGANPNNKIALISPNGYASLTNCLSARAGPTTVSYPVAAVEVSTNTFLVAYAGTTPSANMIVAYQIDTATESNLANASTTIVLRNTSLLMGASSMAFDASENTLYVASSPAHSEKIEKFVWNQTNQTLTRVGSRPFLDAANLTCISSMIIGK